MDPVERMRRAGRTTTRKSGEKKGEEELETNGSHRVNKKERAQN